jgi:hypothetical protein
MVQGFIFIISKKGCYSSVGNEYCRVKAINFVYTCVICLHTNKHHEFLGEL